MPCFWWAPFRSFGVSGVISARVGIRTYFRCHRKSFKLQKGSKRLHLLHRNQIIFCCDHLSQAAKDHEKKDSKHERRDTNKPHECHKQYHDIGHTDWPYRQHVCFTQVQEHLNRVFLCWMCAHSQYLHSLDTEQSTFFSLFVSKTLIKHGWYHQF